MSHYNLQIRVLLPFRKPVPSFYAMCSRLQSGPSSISGASSATFSSLLRASVSSSWRPFSAVPQFHMRAPCALSPYVLWVHKPLPRLCLLIHHRLTFHSIENFLRGQRRWCLKLGNCLPKACSSSFSHMPLLISLDPECLLSSAPFRFCSFSVEDRWGLARYLPKNCRQILFGPLSIHPNALKASQTGLWVKARHSICHSAPGTTLQWLPSYLLPQFPLL